MSIHEKLSQKLSLAESENEQLFEFYVMLWENTVLLKIDQFNELFSRAEKLSKSPKAKCALHLSEVLFYIFYPSENAIFQKLSDTINSFESVEDTAGMGAAQAIMAL